MFLPHPYATGFAGLRFDLIHELRWVSIRMQYGTLTTTQKKIMTSGFFSYWLLAGRLYFSWSIEYSNKLERQHNGELRWSEHPESRWAKWLQYLKYFTVLGLLWPSQVFRSSFTKGFIFSWQINRKTKKTWNKQQLSVQHIVQVHSLPFLVHVVASLSFVALNWCLIFQERKLACISYIIKCALQFHRK